MKKLIGFLLLLTIHTALYGCSTLPANAETTQTQAPTQSKSSAVALVSHPSIGSISEYQQFIATNYADFLDFITYDMIKELGSFVKFTYYFYIDGEYYELTEEAEYVKTEKRYKYLLENSNGQRLLFKVERANEIDKSNIPLLPEAIKSVPNICRIEDAEGVYRYNSLYYYYHNGLLTQTAWINGEYIIKIQSCQNDMSQTIDGDNSIISRLINLETAEAAVAEFNASIAQALAEKAK